MNNENYIVIQGWMINELKLKGTQLLIYALVHGFSQDNETGFRGSIKYIQNSVGVSRSTVIENLKVLVEKELLIKKTTYKNSLTFNTYKTSYYQYENSTGVVENSYGGSTKTVLGGSTKTVPYNTNLDNTNNKLIDKEEQTEIEIWPTFNDFWDLGLPKQDKERSLRYWKKISQADKEKIMQNVPDYVKASGKEFSRGTASYLNQKTWNNEIIDRSKAKGLVDRALSRTGTEQRIQSYVDEE